MPKLQAFVSSPELAEPFRVARVKVVTNPKRLVAPNILVASRITDSLDKIGPLLRGIKSKKSFLLMPGTGRAEDLLPAMKSLQATVSQTLFVSANDPMILRRWAFCRSVERMDAVIHAFWEDSDLVLVAPDFRIMKTPLERIPALRGHSKNELETFDISETGSYIYWPKLDVHLGWESLDIEARLKDAKFRQFLAVGLKRFRQQEGLTQSQMGDERQVRRMERGQITLHSLSGIARHRHIQVDDLVEQARRAAAAYIASSGPITPVL